MVVTIPVRSVARVKKLYRDVKRFWDAAYKWQDFPFLGPTLDVDDAELASRFLRHGYTEQSDVITAFEQRFAEWNDSKYAFTFANARTALRVAAQSLGLRSGDSVVLPGYTCVVVANAFWHSGVHTIFCDIELDTFGPDSVSLFSRVDKTTRAVVIHHLYGLVSKEYERIAHEARERRLHIIEDCAQAMGARYKGIRVGNLGDVAIYSFEQTKVLSTGRGGILTTNSDDLAERIARIQASLPFPSEEFVRWQLRVVRVCAGLHARGRAPLSDLFWWIFKGPVPGVWPNELKGGAAPDYMCRMPSAIAAIGLNQLAKSENYFKLRWLGAQYWADWCRKQGYTLPLVLEDSNPVFLRYPVLVEPERKRNPSWAKQELGIELGMWFRSHLHPAEYTVVGCPNADTAVARCVNLPTILRKSRQQ
jgi:perosamine synthetase